MDILNELERYIKINPNLLTSEEKVQLRQELIKYIKAPERGVKDILLEFFVSCGITKAPENEFLQYIITKYPVEKFPRVLEVATGKMCVLARKLQQSGYKVTAIDPNIRIQASDPRVKKVKLLKRKFTTDFDTKPYDIILGYNACPVAGALLNVKNKPIIFTICDAPQTDGKLDIGVEIKSKQEFTHELSKRGGTIRNVGELTIVDNSRVLQIKPIKCNEER